MKRAASLITQIDQHIHSFRTNHAKQALTILIKVSQRMFPDALEEVNEIRNNIEKCLNTLISFIDPDVSLLKSIVSPLVPDYEAGSLSSSRLSSCMKTLIVAVARLRKSSRTRTQSTRRVVRTYT